MRQGYRRSESPTQRSWPGMLLGVENSCPGPVDPRDPSFRPGGGGDEMWSLPPRSAP